MSGALPDPERVGCWVFDLDNTLYSPRECDLAEQMEAAISAFIRRHLGLGAAEADRLRASYLGRYGMTLGGLMAERGVEARVFLEETHRLDLSALRPAPRLAGLLARLPGRRIVHTNAPAAHAERVLARLGLEAHFEAVFDLEAAGYRPKPDPEGYRRLLARHAVDPGTAVMVEDRARNLAPAAAAGMTTVWVRTHLPGAATGLDPALVHHVAESLEDWLETVTRPSPP